MSAGHACLDLEVTRRCNLRCDYCFVGWDRGWSGDLDPVTARTIVDEGAGRFEMLHLTGGEPFAWAPLLDLVDQAIGLGYREVLINSNGTLLDEARVSALGARRNHVRVSISLDGPAELHDRVRGLGAFAAADQAVARLLAVGVPTTVMTVVTRPVLACLTAFLADLHGRHRGLAGVTFFPVGVGARSEGKGTQKPGTSHTALSATELRRLALLVALADRSGLGCGIGAYPIVNPWLRQLGYPEERLYQCDAGRGRLCVHADLGVSSCHPVKEPIYGQWRPGLFDEIEKLEVHARLGRRDFDGCRTCPEREGCGHCRAFVAASGEPLFGNDGVCHDVLGHASTDASPVPTGGPRRVRLHVIP